MASFSIGRAGTAGLELIRRQPVAVLAWGLAYLALYGGPAILMIGGIMQMVSALAPKAQNAALDPSLMASVARMQAANLLVMVGALVARAIVYSAICRAMLQPEDRAFAYLRLGVRELWVGLVMLTAGLMMGFGAVLGALALAIPLGIVGLVAHNPAIWPLLIVVGVVVLVAGIVWVALRLCLAVPMTFAAGQFQLFESWAMTRGRVLSLLGVGLVAMAVMLAIEVVLILLFCLVGFGVAAVGVAQHWTSLSAAAVQSPAVVMRQILPWMASALAVLCLFMGAALAIVCAPFVSVYRSLSAPPPASPWGTPAA